MKWNVDLRDSVLNYDSIFDDKNLVDKLLCDYNRLKEDNIFSDYYYFSRGENQDHVAGYAFDNIPIFNALIINNYSDTGEETPTCSTENCDTVEYRDAYENETDTMDYCLARVDLTNTLHYRGLGGCMKQFNTLLDGTFAPELCKNAKNKECTKDPFKWAMKSKVFAEKEFMDIGLARDGHVIKGPYNEDGELWTCEDIDICNGTYLSDGSYAYVATSTFPYIVGCWGPATQ